MIIVCISLLSWRSVVITEFGNFLLQASSHVLGLDASLPLCFLNEIVICYYRNFKIIIDMFC